MMISGLDQAFALAAAELGMASAAWLFVEEVAGEEGVDGVERLRDSLGRQWPVLDAIAAAWQSGRRAPDIDPGQLKKRLQGLTRLVVVGLEARWLDALWTCLDPQTRVGFLRHSEFDPDWQRVQWNFGERAELLDLADFQAWAGARSALLTFVYGVGQRPFALSAWIRVYGLDVRMQFRDLLGWDVLQVPISVYPRWLVAVPAEQFTVLQSSR